MRVKFIVSALMLIITLVLSKVLNVNELGAKEGYISLGLIAAICFYVGYIKIEQNKLAHK